MLAVESQQATPEDPAAAAALVARSPQSGLLWQGLES
jgi:hypothetical protein